MAVEHNLQCHLSFIWKIELASLSMYTSWTEAMCDALWILHFVRKWQISRKRVTAETCQLLKLHFPEGTNSRLGFLISKQTVLNFRMSVPEQNRWKCAAKCVQHEIKRVSNWKEVGIMSRHSDTRWTAVKPAPCLLSNKQKQDDEKVSDTHNSLNYISFFQNWSQCQRGGDLTTQFKNRPCLHCSKHDFCKSFQQWHNCHYGHRGAIQAGMH